MRFIVKGDKELRTGITTGSCAVAAAKAAAIMLLSGEFIKTVKFRPKVGEFIVVDVLDAKVNNLEVSCAVIKDAGDDPDITNGIKIVATVFKIESGIVIDGGGGVGRVTRSGLKVKVGQPAINPVPLEMIEMEIKEVIEKYKYAKGLKIVISVPNGAEIAKKTMNERLGIVGGISILGTTGIVEPMSDKAVIDTIKTEMSVHVSAGAESLIITPGNYGRDFAKKKLGIDVESAIKCSNFIGETLDYAKFIGAKNITLIGHAGKLVKLAGGIMDTYSKIADCRMEIIAVHCAMLGASKDVIKEIMDCITVEAAIAVMRRKFDLHEQVWESIGKKISFHIRQRTERAIFVKFIVFTEEYGVLIDSNTECWN